MPTHIDIDVDFDNSIDVTQVINEPIIVPSIPNFKGSRYVYRLKYIPTLGDPTKLPTIPGLTKVEGVSPATGEFRIVEQALNLDHVSPNIIEFNSAQAGNSYNVSYWRYAENQDAEKVVYHDVLRDVMKSDKINLDFSTAQVFIDARSMYYFRNKIIIEDSQVAITPTLAASTIYYLYCDDFKGTNFYEGVYSTSTTVPAFSSTKLGWYNNDSKAICRFTTDGSSNIILVESLGYKHPELHILTVAEDITLNQYEDYDIIESDTTDGENSITVPTGAVVKGKKIKLKQLYSKGRTNIIGTIDGKTNDFLDSANDNMEIYYNGAEWKKINYDIVFESGFINTSDVTNRELGTIEVDYNNLSGTFTLGATVTGGTSTSTGIIMADDGATLKLRNITNGGIFTNTEQLTDNATGVTADVNEPSGSNKNLDSNIFHNYNEDLKDLEIEFYISTDGTWNNAFFVQFDAVVIGAGQHYGKTFYQINSNEFKVQTGNAGYLYLDDSGITQAIGAQDWYYNVIIKRRR